jgi:hypothetical protein
MAISKKAYSKKINLAKKQKDANTEAKIGETTT